MTQLVDTIGIDITANAGVSDSIDILIDADRSGIPDAIEACAIDHVITSQCLHTPEQFAEVALLSEPRGAFWSKGFGTIKAALYRAFGRLLSDFESRMCGVYKELLACDSVELLNDWEIEYGTKCVDTSSLSLQSRQALICQARSGTSILTMPQLELLLQTALECPLLKLEYASPAHALFDEYFDIPFTPIGGGVCIRNIGPVPLQPSLDNWFDGHFDEHFKVLDDSFDPPDQCPLIFSTAPGDYDPVRYPLLVCLLNKHLPAHIEWAICPT